jgi:hypothetical protein
VSDGLDNVLQFIFATSKGAFFVARRNGEIERRIPDRVPWEALFQTRIFVDRQNEKVVANSVSHSHHRVNRKPGEKQAALAHLGQDRVSGTECRGKERKTTHPSSLLYRRQQRKQRALGMLEYWNDGKAPYASGLTCDCSTFPFFHSSFSPFRECQHQDELFQRNFWPHGSVFRFQVSGFGCSDVKDHPD